MSLENLLAKAGMGEFVEQEFFLAQVGLLGGSIILVLISLVFCILAFRAAGAARTAREESELMFQSAQDLAGEMRHLTAQVERKLHGESELSGAGVGVEAASVPGTPIVHASETETAVDASSGSHEQKPVEGEPSRDRLAFVDAAESEVDAVPNEQQDAESHDYATRDAQAEIPAAARQNISSLLRRRR